MRLLIATENRGKLREFRQILATLPLEVVAPADLGLCLTVAEEAGTFAGNATLKARAYAAASGLPALADDSGLEVDALDGRPGVLSARYAGVGASEADRRRRLLAELQRVPEERRGARFRCVVALVWGGRTYTAEGVVEGRIACAERGRGGFGYDSLFYLPDSGLTLAELGDAEKDAVSHRGQAARRMALVLQRLISSPDVD